MLHVTGKPWTYPKQLTSRRNHRGMRTAGIKTPILANKQQQKQHKTSVETNYLGVAAESNGTFSDFSKSSVEGLQSTLDKLDSADEVANPKLTDTCSICADTVLLSNFVEVACCRQKLCRICVNHIIETKATQASEILAMYLSRSSGAHQCPNCETGPIEHFACSDLTGSAHNRCPKCQFSSHSINAWPKWNGKLCDSLRAYNSDGKHIDCPFCRQQAVLLSKIGISGHSFQPKRKSFKSPLSRWCTVCNQHKNQHLLGIM